MALAVGLKVLAGSTVFSGVALSDSRILESSVRTFASNVYNTQSSLAMFNVFRHSIQIPNAFDGQLS